MFVDFDIISNWFGNIVKDKNICLVVVLKGVVGLDFGYFDSVYIDLFGDVYEYFIFNYVVNVGKFGGEFFML